ncbi:MAG: FIST C-terminal domain-containing protein [Gemmataceae bacterium]|nr:FIST C-terminal domain-containing protein [Gemmataceae bacterium]
MPFAAALSTAPQAVRALDDVCTETLRLLSAPPQLAVLFFSPHHAAAAATIAATVQERVKARCLIGCIGESIVGNDEEIEHRPALALWLGSWSTPVEIEPFHLAVEQTPDGPSLLGFPDSLVGANLADAAMLLLGDPFSFPVNEFLEQVNSDHRGLRIMGGMASGVRGPGQCRLLLGERVLEHGAVGVLLQGVKLRSIVSQGCRPIGQHFVVTGGHDNIITELGGKAPMQQLQKLWQELSPEEQSLFQQGLHIGMVMNEYQDNFQRGDFLVRNVMGLERETGSLAITDRVRVGQTIQFHVRDAQTADEDLRALLQRDHGTNPRKPGGGLLFTCNGRGSRFFPEPNHDATMVRFEAGAVPLAGFFAQGELGPIGGQNFIHGFTASVVLFEE